MPFSCLYNYSVLSKGNLLGQINPSPPVCTMDHIKHSWSEGPSVVSRTDRAVPMADRSNPWTSDSLKRSHGGSASGKSDWGTKGPTQEVGVEMLMMVPVAFLIMGVFSAK